MIVAVEDARAGQVGAFPGGEPERVMPRNYTVRFAGRKGAGQSVAVRAKEKATVRF